MVSLSCGLLTNFTPVLLLLVTLSSILLHLTIAHLHWCIRKVACDCSNAFVAIAGVEAAVEKLGSACFSG